MKAHLVRNTIASALSIMASLAITSAIAQEETVPPATPALPGEPLSPKGVPVPAQVKLRALDREMSVGTFGGSARATDKPMYADRLRAIVGPAEDQTLIVPKDAGDLRRGGETDMEDMVVMEHILEKAATESDQGKQAMGIQIRGAYGVMGSTRKLYIDGYGALFFMNVNYPLLPPSVTKEPEPRDSSNADWDQARRELRHENEPFGLTWAEAGGPRSGGEEYTAEKVEALKRNVLMALKNAAHIRPLKSDETITVVVTGRGSGPAKFNRKKIGSDDGAPSAADHADAEGKPARLLLRARKSDADAFLRDKLGFDEFRKKATVFIY